MGYTTDFSGSISLSKPLSEHQREYLNMLADTRRMKRDNAKIEALDPADQNKRCLKLLKILGLGLGNEGEYYCGIGDCGQTNDPSVTEGNFPPSGQPSLWLQWRPIEDGTEISWDEGEKFYEYVPWIKYLIDNFIKPWGIIANGSIKWQGEDMSDRGIITVKDNVVSSHNLE